MVHKTHVKCCPVETALKHIGKKWAINIVRDLFAGKKRFTDFLDANPNLSTKMLSARLKELERDGIIEKKIISTSPVTIEYALTKRGKRLNRVLYEMSLFSFREYSGELYTHATKKRQSDITMMKSVFGIS